MKFSLIAQALMLLLATSPSAWAESSNTQMSILRVESKELILVWAKETRNPIARIECAGTKNRSELSDECKLLNSLGITLLGPDLRMAKEAGKSAYISQTLQDAKYHGSWIVSFGPGQDPAVKPDFFGYKISIDTSGRIVKAIPVTKEEGFKIERHHIPGSIHLGEFQISGYDHSSAIYRSVK